MCIYYKHFKLYCICTIFTFLTEAENGVTSGTPRYLEDTNPWYKRRGRCTTRFRRVPLEEMSVTFGEVI